LVLRLHTKVALYVALCASLVCCGRGGEHKRQLRNAPPQRIVSLTCAATDILDALGQMDRVVAVEADCPAPGTAGKVKIQHDDHAGKARPLNLEAVLALSPDLVVAKESLRGMLDERAVSVVWAPATSGLDAVPEFVRSLAMATGAVARGEALLAKMAADRGALLARTSSLSRVRVYYETTGLGRTVGKRSTVHAMLALAGGENIAGSLDSALVVLTAEAILAADPEVIVLSPFADPEAEVRARKGFAGIAAVRSGRIHRVPIEQRQVLLATPRCIDGCAQFFLPWLHPELAAEDGRR
jgi:iron complex transport system substrate-binding protein